MAGKETVSKPSRAEARRRQAVRRGARLKRTRTSHQKLGTWLATAICGNDITSSCLYVSALSIAAAGALAPVALLTVAFVLFLYRGVYAEAVGALPMNGGAYNTLLNTTSKYRASVAAALTILSYMATAVISGVEAIHYVTILAPESWIHGLDDSIARLVPMIGEHGSVMLLTAALLTAFAVLNIMGITESARVALGIFIFHMVTLTVLALSVGWFLLFGEGGHLAENIALPLPQERSLLSAVFFGFAAAMLGISGFESSSNYVEEQAPGVFPKTLRNMWVAVSVFNPLMAVLALAVLPMVDIAANEEALLARLGLETGGGWLRGIIAADAALVLSGAVLTSFVGVSGLVYRMTLDRCLPQSLLRKNRWETPYRITLVFLLAGLSVLVITGGEVKALAGVYTISFLSVMALFAVGNMLLKIKRARLPRPSRSSWPATLAALAAVLIGLLGNVVVEPDYAWIFVQYFVPTMLVITVMLTRIQLLALGVAMVQAFNHWVRRRALRVSRRIRQIMNQIESQQVVFFTRGDHIANLNQAMLYIKQNEHTNRVRVVIAARDPKDVPKRLATDLEMLNEAYPQMDITLEIVDDDFGPALLERLSEEWNVPLNFMFIGSPGDRFPHNLAELGGVRLII